MSSNELTVRSATLSDLPTILEVLTEAARWGWARGIENWWPIPYPADRVRPGIERGEFVVGERSGLVVGTLRLSKEDPRTWGEQPPVAGYVHQLAVRRSLQGEGIGKAMLEWAAVTVRAWGRSKLRLDCLATNESLVRYYRELGFREVGRIPSPLPGELRDSLLLEKDLT